MTDDHKRQYAKDVAAWLERLGFSPSEVDEKSKGFMRLAEDLDKHMPYDHDEAVAAFAAAARKFVRVWNDQAKQQPKE